MRRISSRLALALGAMALLCAAPAVAAPKTPAKQAAQQADASSAQAQSVSGGFDAEAFRKNFVAGLSGRANAPALKPADVRVEGADKAAAFAGTDIYMVRGALSPGDGPAQPFTMFVSADGRFYVSDIVELGAGKSILKDARDKMRAADLKDLGHSLMKGTGTRTVVYVSDPFCPYCRSAFAYLMGKTASFSELRLAHFPLTSHPGADIACALMAWAAEKAPERSLDFVRFAYTDLAVPKLADKSADSRQKAWVEVASAFLARFPELKALGKDGEAIVLALGGSAWDKAVQEDMGRAAGMDISGTPVIFVDGARVDGFDQSKLGALLK